MKVKQGSKRNPKKIQNPTFPRHTNQKTDYKQPILSINPCIQLPKNRQSLGRSAGRSFNQMYSKTFCKYPKKLSTGEELRSNSVHKDWRLFAPSALTTTSSLHPRVSKLPRGFRSSLCRARVRVLATTVFRHCELQPSLRARAFPLPSL